MCVLKFLPGPVKSAIRAGISAFAPETARIGDAIVHLNRKDPLISGLLTLGLYERREIAFFQKYCGPGMTVVDVGANVGAFSALALRQIQPGGRLFAFEPHPESRQFLERTIAANLAPDNAAEIIAAAAASAPGESRLFLNPNNKADNRLYQSEETPDAISIELCTIDDVLSARGVDRIDFLKTDAQGGDFDALKGARRTLEDSPKMVIISEFWPEGIQTVSGEAPQNYLDYLRGLGFDLYQLGAGASLTPLRDRDADALVTRLTGTDYVNIAAFKGWGDVSSGVH